MTQGDRLTVIFINKTVFPKAKCNVFDHIFIYILHILVIYKGNCLHSRIIVLTIENNLVLDIPCIPL